MSAAPIAEAGVRTPKRSGSWSSAAQSADGTCPAANWPTTLHTNYDSADRIVNTENYAYDPFGNGKT